MPKTIAIIYGWAEGPWESKKFRKELEEKGFRVIEDLSEADAIFGHSSGCYLIPKDIGGKSIFLIGLPFWPGRSLAMSIIYKLHGELKYHRRDESILWWLNKILHNAWYIVSKPSATYLGLTKHHPKYLPAGDTNIVSLVRPSDDTFLHPDVMKLLPDSQSYKFIEIKGAHDDCWIKPQMYIDLLLKEI